MVIKTSRQDGGNRKRKWVKVTEGEKHIHMVWTDRETFVSAQTRWEQLGASVKPGKKYKFTLETKH